MPSKPSVRRHVSKAISVLPECTVAPRSRINDLHFAKYGKSNTHNARL